MHKVRFLLADLLKGIAVLLMIQVHLTELFATPEFYQSLYGKISLLLGGVPAAPLFMVVMGFFIGDVNLKTGKLIFRGLKLIVWGLLLNIGLNLHLFYRIFIGTFQLDPLPYLFGVDILFLAGISILIITLFVKLFQGNPYPFLIAAFLIPLLSDILPAYTNNSGTGKYLMAFIHSSSRWSYFPLIPWLSYPMLGTAAGILYKKYPDKIIKLFSKPFIISIAAVITIIFWSSGFTISADLPLYYHHGLQFFVWAVSLLIIIVLGMNYLLKLLSKDNILVRYLSWTGKNVTSFYVFQWLLIGNLATSLYKTQPPTVLIFWFAGVTVLSSILVWLFNKRSRIIDFFKDLTTE